MIPIPGRMEQGGRGLPHATQSDMEFKSYELLISGIAHVYFQSENILTETIKREIKAKQALL
jgi:hypothetical protein